MIEQGADLREVMDQLGHSTYRLTADLYTHLTVESKQRLAARMDDAMGQKG
jgi:site-specific recombinase XerD